MVKSWERRPLVGVTGSMGDSLPDSALSSIIASGRSDDNWRGDEEKLLE